MEQASGLPKQNANSPKRKKTQNTVYLTEEEDLSLAKGMLKYRERTGQKLSFTDVVARLCLAWDAAGAPDFESIAQIRAIEAKAAYSTSKPIPFYGSVSAGPGALATGAVEDYLSCPPWIADTDDRLFALRVDGMSMANVLLPGDVVVVRSGGDASSGEMVVAEIEDEIGERMGYVKYVRDDGGVKSLLSENEGDNPPRLLHQGSRIIGKVIAAVRYLEGQDLAPERTWGTSGVQRLPDAGSAGGTGGIFEEARRIRERDEGR